MTLYELVDQIANFEFEIDEETGEILNADELDRLELERDTKIENIGLWVKNLQAETEAIKRERDKLTTRINQNSKKIESLESYLTKWLEGYKFSTPRLQIGWRKSQRVEIVNEALVPDKYCDFKVERKPNKTAIKEMLKNGEEVKGATLVENNNIQIK